MTLLGFVLFFLCHGVEGESILGRDLAAADAQFAGMPADARVGYAPIPGARRTLGASELKGIASRYGISGEFREVCFEYPMRVLESGEIREALVTGLGIKDADIEILESSLFSAPKGEVVFPRAALTSPPVAHPADPVIWRGYVKYGAARKFAIWARVRIQVRENRVIAAEDLAAARPARASQLRIEAVNGFPLLQPAASSIEQVEGHVLRRAVRIGAPVLLDSVEGAALDVNRGDAVEVVADAGQAHLKFEARAETGGALGDSVTVRNAKSGKTFPARVVGKGKVAVASE